MMNQNSRFAMMRWVVLIGSAVLCFSTQNSFASGQKTKPAAKHTSSNSGSNFFENLPPPEGVRIYDVVIGPRIGFGSYASATMGFGLNGEYMLTRDIGVGGSFGYSNYSASVGTGSYSYTSMLFIGQGSYHANLFKVKNLDTFATLGIGYVVVSASWSGTGIQPAAASASGLGGVVSLNGRYFFNDQWAVTGSLGYGAGILSVGVDYKF